MRGKAFDYIWSNPSELPEYTYFNFIKKFFGLNDDATSQEIKSILIEYVKNFSCKQVLMNEIALKRRDMGDDDRREVLISTGRDLIRRISANDRVHILAKAFESFYDGWGHISGSYIRNIYYILSHAEESLNGHKYAKVFRAQLSRHELSLIYFNMLSSYCNPHFIFLIRKFDILNGLYLNDLCYNPSDDMYKDDLNYIFLTLIVASEDVVI